MRTLHKKNLRHKYSLHNCVNKSRKNVYNFLYQRKIEILS